MADIVKQIKNSTDIIEYISELSINDLEKVIKYASDKYYNTDTPVISDEIYDILIDFLRLKDSKSKILKTIGAKVKNKVKLDYWLGSMDKIKPPSNQLTIWTNKYKPPYNLSDKLDGVSALLTYTYDGNINMYTRGTATEGTDITHLIKYLNIPSYDIIKKYCQKNNISGIKNLIAFRGELIIKDDIFNIKWSNILKNGRNTVSGLVNSKNINPELALDTNLVLYEVIEPFYSITNQFKIIKDLPFNCVNNKTINQDLSYEFLSSFLKDRRNNSDYQIDGIIVTSIGNYQRNKDGNPEYAFAFKDILEDQKSTTTVLNVEWNISKDGFIKPTVILEPIIIGGVEIRRVTGNNAKFIVDNKIGTNAIVEIIRSGDVIPKIEKIIKTGKVKLPDFDYHWSDSNVDIILNNTSNNDMLIKNIYYFFSKLETKGLGEKNVSKLIDAGLNTIPKILEADKQRLLMVDGFGDKTVDNLLKSIEKALTNVPLYKIMVASNKLGHGIGEEKIKQVLSIYPKILTEYIKWSNEDFINKIKEIDGWEDKTAKLLVSNFNNFITFYNSIKEYIVLENISDIKIITNKNITNKTFVFTGFRDKIIEQNIISKGGFIGSSVSKNTDYLVIKDNTSTSDKVNKAKSLNIKIITKDELIILLNK